MSGRRQAFVFSLALSLSLAACAGAGQGEGQATGEGNQESTTVKVNLPNLGAAPELQNENWLNTDHPLKLADLRGRVVLIDMWTFG